MPNVQNEFEVGGAIRAHNALGVGARTMGGVFDAPVSYTSFGIAPTYATSALGRGDTVALATVNLPAYTLTLGTVVRLSFSGFVIWDGAGGETIQMGLAFAPTALLTSKTFLLGAAVASGVAGTIQVFSGQVELLVLENPSTDSSVAIDIGYTPIATSGAGTRCDIMPLTADGAKSNGVIGLSTAGLLDGTDISITTTMSSTASPVSVRAIQLNRFVTELVGG